MNVSIDYIAGLVDGEGCFSISRSTRAYRGALTIAITDGEALAMVRMAFDKLRIASSFTRRKGTGINKNTVYKDVYFLRVSQIPSLAKLCELLKDRMMIKERQRELMSRFMKLVEGGKPGKLVTDNEVEERAPYYCCMKSLNR